MAVVESLYQRNNFDLIRLVAASQVVVAHGLEHFQIAPGVTRIIAFLPGVPAFFFVSGFLISAAWERHPNLRTFYSNRARRILPALWFAVGLGLLTVVLWYDRDLLAQHVPTLAAWTVAQGTVFQMWNPDILRGYGVGVVNGALWTISVELSFYLMLPLLARWRDRTLIVLLVASFAVQYLVAPQWPALWAKLIIVSLVPWLGMFLTGMLAQRHANRLYQWLAGKIWFAALGVIAMAWLAQRLSFYPLFHGGNSVGILNYLALCVLVFAAAYSSRGQSDRLLQRNDLSYGIYIGHVLVINALLANGATGWLGMVSLLLIIYPAAALSWFLLEKPILRRKRIGLYVHSFAEAR